MYKLLMVLLTISSLVACANHNTTKSYSNPKYDRDTPPSWIAFPPQNHLAWKVEPSPASYNFRTQLAAHRCIQKHGYCAQRNMWSTLDGDLYFLFETRGHKKEVQMINSYVDEGYIKIHK